MKKTKLPNDYFPHDFNARVDRKILRCRKVLGIEGYGIYWMLIETLCTQDNFSYPLKDIDLLADDFGCSVEKVEAVVKQFELFKLDKDGKFFSLSLIARMQKYLELSAKARASVNVRWEKARLLKELEETNTLVLPPHNDSNTIKEKDIKGKKIKEEKIIESATEPTIEEVKKYFKSMGYPVKDGENFYSYYSAQGWETTSGMNIKKTWHKKVIGWMNNQKQFTKYPQNERPPEPKKELKCHCGKDARLWSGGVAGCSYEHILEAQKKRS